MEVIEKVNEKVKGFIVYPTYKLEDGKAYVYLFGRLESGESFLTINAYRPYFFIKTKDRENAEKLIKLDYEKTDFCNFSGEKVTKVILDIPGNMSNIRKLFQDNEIVSYEADIRFAYRYLIDKDLKSAIMIEGKPEDGRNIQPAYFTNIGKVFMEPKLHPLSEKDHYFPKLKVLSFDIETNRDASQLFSISFYSEDFQTVLLLLHEKYRYHHPKIKNAELFTDEAELLKRFKEIILWHDPDIITGWNMIDFDLKILKQRFDKQKIEFKIGRVSWDCKLRFTDNYFTDSTAEVPGRIALDGIHLMKISFVKLPDYKLNTAAKIFLGEEKLITTGDRRDEIERQYEHEPQALVDYNLKDSKLAYDIIHKSKTLELSITRSMLTRMQIDRVKASIASLDSLYLRELQNRKLVAPTAIINESEERIKGGFVMDSKPGIYENILVFDFKSLYPSIIRTFNIDPVSFVDSKQLQSFNDTDKKKLIHAPNGAYFRNEQGILPALIQHLFDLREMAKKEKNDLESNAIKILMNCFTPDTDILTETGIKKIVDVKAGEEVYSLNPKTQKIELNKITKTFKYKYNGKMIAMKTSGVDYVVTPNHRFLIKTNNAYKWFEAQELLHKATKNFWLPKHTPIKGKKKRLFSLKQKCEELNVKFRLKQGKLQKGPKHSSIPQEYSMKDWLQLLGWYISEGYTYIYKPKRYPGKVSWRGISYRTMICQKQKDNRDKIITLIKRMGFKYSMDQNGIIVTNQVLAEVLLTECGSDSYTKRIPLWVFKLDHQLLIELFRSLMLGDGDNKGDRYSTCNELLAHDVLRIIHHLGYYGFVYKDVQKYNGLDYNMYRVQINKSRSLQPYISKYRNIREIGYKGYVYCVEVSPNHTVLAGRNTKLNFCGQSFFGVLANPTCRFYSLEVANAITHFGQFIIKLSGEKIKELGYDVIYGDTDSLFVNPNTAVTKVDGKVNIVDYNESQKIGTKIQKFIEEFYVGYIKENYNRKSFLELKFEKTFKKFILPKVRGSDEGAKKRYAGIVEKDGKDTTEFTGLEFVRRDWTDAAKKFQLELLSIVFESKINAESEEEKKKLREALKTKVSKYIKDYIADLKKGEYDSLLVYKKAIRKGVESYTKTTPPHIKAARKAGRTDSGIIEYLQTVNGPEVIEARKSAIDYPHYLEKQIKPIAESILGFFDINFDDLFADSRQMKLGGF